MEVEDRDAAPGELRARRNEVPERVHALGSRSPRRDDRARIGALHGVVAETLKVREFRREASFGRDVAREIRRGWVIGADGSTMKSIHCRSGSDGSGSTSPGMSSTPSPSVALDDRLGSTTRGALRLWESSVVSVASSLRPEARTTGGCEDSEEWRRARCRALKSIARPTSGTRQVAMGMRSQRMPMSVVLGRAGHLRGRTAIRASSSGVP